MYNTLKQVSEKAILLNELNFSVKNIQEKWLGEEPAKDEEIIKAERKLQINLPDEYRNFLLTTNGFPAVTNIGITFLPIEKVDYLKNLDNSSLIEIWSNAEELKKTGTALEKSILVGGLDEEQYFLLVPPYGKFKKWRFWHFASWNLGEWPFKNIESYFKHELSFLKQQTKGLKFPKPKPIIDYSLRDYMFGGEWEKAVQKTEELFRMQTLFPYFENLIDLLKIHLICCSKLNKYKEAEQYFQELIIKTGLDINENDILSAFVKAAKQKHSIPVRFDNYHYSLKEKNITSKELQQQIEEYRKDLLKPNNHPDKVNYELYFLFEYGDSKDFIVKYETNIEHVSYREHLQAASIYASMKRINQAKNSVIQYWNWNQMFRYRPFEPFFNSNILGIMDEDFLKNAYLKFQQQ